MIDLADIESRINVGIYGDDRMTSTERDDAFSALAALLAEVERLRDEAEVLALRGEVERERAAVVKWLRAEADEPHTIEVGKRALSPSGRGLLLLAASRIERGEHRREGAE